MIGPQTVSLLNKTNPSATRERLVLHVDMDAFYTSIEQVENPELQNKSVIVGAPPGSRGVVSAASYEARVYGVHSAMPISTAFKLCPHGVYLRPDMKKYAAVSKRVMELFKFYSPKIEPISIDEAFLDGTGIEKLWGSGEQLAKAVYDAVLTKTGLTCSIGIAPNKFLAKLSSTLNKPRQISTTPSEPGEIIKWLAPMPVSNLWGVGNKTREKLALWKWTRIGDLQKQPLNTLTYRLGKYGTALYYLCRGVDLREIETTHHPKSISREHTFGSDCSDKEGCLQVLLTLCREVARRARAGNLSGNTVTLIYRSSNFKKHSRQQTLPQPSHVTSVVYKAVKNMFQICFSSVPAFRLLGVGLSGFENNSQETLPFEDLGPFKKTDKAMDALFAKFGKDVVVYGRELKRGAHSQPPSGSR